VFCIYLRINSDLCHLQHKLIAFYNRDEKCLQRDTDWVFIMTAVVSGQYFNDMEAARCRLHGKVAKIWPTRVIRMEEITLSVPTVWTNLPFFKKWFENFNSSINCISKLLLTQATGYKVKWLRLLAAFPLPTREKKRP